MARDKQKHRTVRAVGWCKHLVERSGDNHLSCPL
jgi:hypothetical protein